MSIRTELTFELGDRQTPKVHATTRVHATPIQTVNRVAWPEPRRLEG
jgi:hypothetical protein